MADKKKALLIFDVLRALRHGAYTQSELAQKFHINYRTAGRYLEDLEYAGFYVEQRTDDRRYFIYSAKPDEERYYFTPEETDLVKQLLAATNDEHPLRSSLLKKVYTLSEAELVGRHTLRPELAERVMKINRAIRDRRGIVLKDYRSGSTGTADRYVEPVAFGADYKILHAFDVSKRAMRSFKIDRMAGVMPEDMKAWEHEAEHKIPDDDPFGFNEGEQHTIHLKLSTLARNLMAEEHPETRPGIYEQGDSYYYKGRVYSLRGVGRFVLSLINDVEILEPRELKAYLKEKIERAGLLK